MKFNKLAMALGLGVVLSSGMVNAADQGTGTVTFHGSIVDAPCSIAPGSSDQSVDLGQVAVKQLANGGTSTPTSFTIDLKDCDADSTVTATFGGALAEASNTKLLGIIGTASGAGVAIVDGSGNVMDLGTASAGQALLEGDNSLTFAAYLQGLSAGTAVPGDFTAISDFVLTYE